jgi:hypothetical protein
MMNKVEYLETPDSIDFCNKSMVNCDCNRSQTGADKVGQAGPIGDLPPFAEPISESNANPNIALNTDCG